MNKRVLRYGIIAFIFFLSVPSLKCQTTVPEILQKGTLDEQLNYLEEKTRIYENYRAIREDMFQLVKKNSSDSLSEARNSINSYIITNRKLNFRIDSLNSLVVTAREELNQAVRTKNSIRLLGFKVNKYVYNTIMWIVAGLLGFLLVTGFLAFRRNLSVTSNLKKELEDLNAEFEEYKKKSRLEREKMSKEHFDEVRRLKGKGV
jgi:cell division protein FtsB